ncbi:glycosyltransferase family 25 protein [Chelativorans sp. AA-79]|uniref:glycosyltransferase family 25 protein n=1 Tax=Chelativorans sp. AA-79 TaxID=3028735 RepID=UPI0023F9FD5D|nr:glycosyltransferase family 25 protein [Chelativorans sp. AA-79]WEX11190.1 glycosyltransferase family 25 protein [Chelativorans sp. AA-79]
MRAAAFIIHLARARGRAPQVERLREALPMPVTVINAIDAETLSDAEIARTYRSRLHRPYYPFSLRRTEVACFLSHRRAWQMVIEHGLEAGLVIEDDVELLPQFGNALDLGLERAATADFLRFPKQPREHGEALAQAGESRLFVPRMVGLGMQAQLVGREAARRLLAFTDEFDRPVDTAIQMRWLHGVRVLSSTPVSVREVAATLGGTTVQRKGKSLSETLGREFHRARYRFAVRATDVLKSRQKPGESIPHG